MLHRVVGLGAGGKALNLILLLGSILVLLNLERTFRASVGIMRWRIKYLFFGIGLLFSANIYTASQALLYSGIHAVSIQINSMALLMASSLIAYSFLRTKFAETEIYPSQKVLQQSFTVILAGAYLVVVGVLANMVVFLGGDPSFPVKAFLLMLAVVCLGIVVLSDKIQQRIKLFVTRHFNRPAHDHRKIWAACTERTSLLVDPIDLSRAVVKLISETFELLSVTLWLSDDNRRTLALGASTSLTADQSASLLSQVKDVEELLQTARVHPGPVDLDKGATAFARSLRELDPDHFGKGGSRVCLTLVSGGEPVGFITVADRVNGRSFSVEDLDLLTCIADQVAGSFRNLEISRSLIQNKEMQAFQAMSAFFVHDLKNTASTLSLMLRNLTSHFGNPEFREDCLRSLSRSVTHINDLIKRLTLLPRELDLKTAPTDLNELVSRTIADLGDSNGSSFLKDFDLLPKIATDPEQLRKVVTNLLINAKEATGGRGEILVSTFQRDPWVVLSVADNGCGMSPEFLARSLFRPFQTTKKSGFGIGMFHTKTIVEAHRGKIEVESEPGKGTTFRVLLPLTRPSEQPN